MAGSETALKVASAPSVLNISWTCLTIATASSFVPNSAAATGREMLDRTAQSSNAVNRIGSAPQGFDFFGLRIVQRGAKLLIKTIIYFKNKMAFRHRLRRGVIELISGVNSLRSC